MERFECKYMENGGVCFRRCFLDFERVSFPPCRCVVDGKLCRWELILSSPRPVLTCEELEKQGIKWPEWATAATVNYRGQLAFWKAPPKLVTESAIGEYWKPEDGSGYCHLNLLFDNSGWRSRIVKRPALVPDWCKPGALVNLNEKTSKLCKVIGVSTDNGIHVHCYFMSNGQRDNRFVPLSSLSPVIMLPWDERQMSEKTGRVFDFSSSRELCVYYERGKGLKFGFGGSDFYSAEALAQSIEITFEGQPCGWLTEGKR